MIAENKTQTATLESASAKVNQFLANYLESQFSLWDSYVDPKEAYLGPDGELWNEIGKGTGNFYDPHKIRTLPELWQAQALGRYLWRENEFAINGHTNRINYIVGWSHVYTVVEKKNHEAPEGAVARVQAVLDRILKVNKWPKRQKETLLRGDRDGETFIRKFRVSDGLMRFRFIEPESIKPPSGGGQDSGWGIVTEEDDIETVLGYYVDGEEVEAEKIQHRKYNVDCSTLRGMPLFYPVRQNLGRAGKLLRNMSIATEIQTAIALIRKHEQSTQEAVRVFVNKQAAFQKTVDGETKNVMHYGPGSIVDAPRGQDYTVPKQLDPSKTVTALQAELRACSSRLVMPEFMLTSDASNGSYSSTLVAEGPAVKNFESNQQTQIDYDLELLNESLEYAADSGLISKDDIEATEIQAEAPSVRVRDELKEAQTAQLLSGLGYLSTQTGSAQFGLNYEQEQNNREAHFERSGAPITMDRPALNDDDSGLRPDDSEIT